jgi:hypothetical protein
MSGTQPVTMANPPKIINTGMWLWCEGGVGCTRCCAMSATLAPSSCNQVCSRRAHQLSERAHAPSPCLNTNHKPLEANKHVVVEPCKRGGVVQSGCRGNGAVLLCHSKPMFQATPKHVLHAFTQAEHRSPTQNSAMRCLWCVQ